MINLKQTNTIGDFLNDNYDEFIHNSTYPMKTQCSSIALLVLYPSFQFLLKRHDVKTLLSNNTFISNCAMKDVPNV